MKKLFTSILAVIILCGCADSDTSKNLTESVDMETILKDSEVLAYFVAQIKAKDFLYENSFEFEKIQIDLSENCKLEKSFCETIKKEFNCLEDKPKTFEYLNLRCIIETHEAYLKSKYSLSDEEFLPILKLSLKYDLDPKKLLETHKSLNNF